MRQRLAQAYSLRRNWHTLYRASDSDWAVIDGLRAMSILWVILFHCLFPLGQFLAPAQLQQFIDQYPAIFNFGWQGDKGVDSFFVISGFLIGSMLFQPEQARIKNTPKFYWARIMRIMPVYLLAILIGASRNWEKYAEHILSNMFFLEKIIPDAITIVPGGWSLGVEMHFYLMAPFLAMLLLRVPQKACHILIACIIGTLSARFAITYFDPTHAQTALWNLYFHNEAASGFNKAVYVLSPFRAAPLFMGMLAAWLVYNKAALLPKTAFAASSLFVAGALVALLTASIPLHNPESAYYSLLSRPQQLAWEIINRAVFGVGITLVLLSLLSTPQTLGKKLFAWRPWRPISQLVLPMYLFHFAWIAAAAFFVLGDIKALAQASNWDILLIFTLGSVFAFLFAIVIYLAIERPFMNLRYAKKPQ